MNSNYITPEENRERISEEELKKNPNGVLRNGFDRTEYGSLAKLSWKGTEGVYLLKSHYALQLYDYHVWANNKFFSRLKELPKDIYNRQIQSVFPSILETLIHIYRGDTIWLGVMQEKSMDDIQASILRARDSLKNKSLEEMETLFYDLSKSYLDFLNNESDLDKEISPEHPKYGRLETKLSHLIQHVVNHGTYHRGNLTAMIHQLGYSSVPTDYVFYLYEMSYLK